MRTAFIESSVLRPSGGLLIRSDGSSMYVDECPRGSWTLNGDDSIVDLVRLRGSVLVIEPEQRYIRMIKHINVDERSIEWCRLLPDHEIKRVHDEIVRTVSSALNDERTIDYYVNVWKRCTKTLNALQPAKSDRSLSEFNQSFSIDHEGFMSIPRYERFNKSHRLSVKAGPRFMTLPHQHRGALRSRFGSKGSLISIDFSSLETRILLAETDKWKDVNDIYARIKLDMNLEADRSAVKQCTISALYGGTARTIGQKLQIDTERSREFVSSVRSLFNIDKFISERRDRLTKNLPLLNKYGRMLMNDDSLDKHLVSSYAQSTAVDITLMCFGSMIDAMKCDGLASEPLFIVHDAMVFDVKNDELSWFKSVDGLYPPKYDRKFFFKVEPFV